MPAADGTFEVGTVVLEVVPVFRGVQDKIRREAKSWNKEINDGLDNVKDDGAQRLGQRIGQKLGDELEKHVSKKVQGISDMSMSPDMDLRKAEARMGHFEKQVKASLKRAFSHIGDDATPSVLKLRAEMEKLHATKITPEFNTSKLVAEMGVIRRELKRLDAEGDIGIGIQANNVVKTIEQFDRVERTASKLDGRQINVDVDADTGAATAKLTLFDRLLGKTDNSSQQAANSFRAFSGVLLTALVIGPALIPVLAALAGGLLALVPILAAVVLGFGVFGLGLSGIMGAVQALGKQQENAKKDHKAYSDAVKNAAESVSDAERALKRAREDSAQAAEDAQRRVQDAYAQAADGIKSALESERQAQEALTSAQRDAAQAQRDLVAARNEAQKQIVDTRDALRQNQLDERQAIIDLFNAEVANTAAQQDPGATPLEREQASINEGNARLRLKEIREEQRSLRQEARRNAREGVAGTETVQSAQEALTAALNAQEDAVRNLGAASADVDQARLDGAESIRDAIRAQTRSQEDSADSVSDAQRALTRAQQDYRDALEGTGTSGTTSMDNVRKAMEKLTPAGRRFARYIFSLREGFKRLRGVAAKGFLPELQGLMEAIIHKYGRGFTRFVRRMSHAVGDLLDQAKKTFTSDLWQDFFKMVDKLSPKLFKNFGKTFLNFLSFFAALATIAAPLAVVLSDALLDLSRKARRWIRSSEGTKKIQDFLDYVKRVGPKVTKFLSALAGAFFAIGEALAPLGGLVLDALTGILNFIAGMDPDVLRAILISMIGLGIAFQVFNAIVFVGTILLVALTTPLGVIILVIAALAIGFTILYMNSKTFRDFVAVAIPAIKGFFLDLWDAVKPTLDEFAKALMKLVDLIVFAWPVIKVILWLMGKIFLLVIKFIILPTLKFLVLAFLGMAIALKDAIGVMIPLLRLFAKVFGWLWRNILSPIWDKMKVGWEKVGDGFSWVYKNVIKPTIDLLVSAFEKAVAGIKSVWHSLKAIFKAPIKFLIDTVINGGLLRAYNWLDGKLNGLLPGNDLKLSIPGFAYGGVYPGYTPGRDIGYVGVSGGEAIMRPEWTRAIGKKRIDEMNLIARTAGASGVAKYLGGFGRGGFVKPIAYAPSLPWGFYPSGGYHPAIDFPGPVGGAIVAVLRGIVKRMEDFVGPERRLPADQQNGYYSYGRDIEIDHGNGKSSFYAHMFRRAFGLKVGQKVDAGDLIGYSGNYGYTFGPHLHMEMRVGGLPYNYTTELMTGRPISPTLASLGVRESGFLGGLSELGQFGKAAYEAARHPKNFFTEKISGSLTRAKGLFGDGFMSDIVQAFPKTIIEGLADFVKDKVSGLLSVSGLSAEDNRRIMGIRRVDELKQTIADVAKGAWGWNSDQIDAIDWIVNRESSFDPTARNAKSGAYGLFQFLPSTWASYGVKETSDPLKQISAGLRYIHDRYGDPLAAKAFWQANGWYKDGGVVDSDTPTMMYDRGGYLPPGITQVVNLTGRPEPVLTGDQWERIGSGSGVGTHLTVNARTMATAGDIADEMFFAMRRLDKGGAYAG